MNIIQVLTFPILCLLLGANSLVAQESTNSAVTLDDLLVRVIEQRNAEGLANQKRLERFKKAVRKQAETLASAQNETLSLEARSDELNGILAENERTLAGLQTQLTDRLGNFGELFGVARQVAGDTRAQVKQSIISAEFPGRNQALEIITDSKKLPTIDQLRQLWVVLLQEQTEQGKVSRFATEISNEQGLSEIIDVVRVGSFNAISSEGFLIYDGDTEQLAQLPRQPASHYTQTAKNLLDISPATVVNTVVDPSSGTILSLLIKAPNLLERFHQGGLPGYLVSALAVVGLCIGLYRICALWWVGLRVRKQIHSNIAFVDNPLGRVLRTYQDNPNLDIKTLELKLEDAILKELPSLDRGLSILKVLAAVAPLIGLLGTVIGMILTFQAITLWGTGEPKIMAGGISQALVTTVQGLVAAIPLLLLHSFTNSQARLIQHTLEEQSAGIIAQRAEARQIKIGAAKACSRDNRDGELRHG